VTFTYLIVSMFILHILLNHVTALDIIGSCLMFLQLQAIHTCYSTKSGLTQTHTAGCTKTSSR